MPSTLPFHSMHEPEKPVEHRVYHNNSACPAGRSIPHYERRQGDSGYRLCQDCKEMNRLGH